MDISSAAGNKNVLISLFDRTTPVPPFFPDSTQSCILNMMPLFLLISYHALDNMGDISFSPALIHSLMNFYSGTTQAGDNKFVSPLVCASPHGEGGHSVGPQEIHEHEAIWRRLWMTSLLPADFTQPEPANNFAHKS